MTRQEIFDKVWDGLKTQGFKQSYNKISGTCHYRGPDGLKCAAGHLIPDNEYDPAIEFITLEDITWFQNNFTETEIKFIGKLQTCHDAVNDDSEIESAFRKLAAKQGLTIND